MKNKMSDRPESKTPPNGSIKRPYRYGNGAGIGEAFQKDSIPHPKGGTQTGESKKKKDYRS